MKKIMGLLLLISPLVAVLVFAGVNAGWWVPLVIIGILVTVFSTTYVALKLITS